MGRFGRLSNLPPGVTARMIPGCRPEDDEWYDAVERVLEDHPDIDRESVEFQRLVEDEVERSQPDPDAEYDRWRDEQ